MGVQMCSSNFSCNFEHLPMNVFIDKSLYNSSYDIALSLYLNCITLDVLIQDTVIENMIANNFIQYEDIMCLYNCDSIPIACLNYLFIVNN